MANAPSVSELVLRWQELRERGQTVSAAELCGECPELLDDVKGRLEALQSMERFLGTAGEPPAGEAETIPAGTQLGDYRIGGRLGAGGMGLVYRAEDVRLGRAVALKVMRSSLAAGATARQRFLREARAMAALRHPHVVTIYQVGEDCGRPFLAMELLEGESLEARLARVGRLPPAEVVRLGRAVADGLAAAHARGVIHRDVKPANVWLEAGPAGEGVKILDFGLARAVTDDAQLTTAGVVVGTPAYMAPEQAHGQPVDTRCDLFSLGAVLYRACTGRVPFSGPDAVSTLLAVAGTRPAPPRQLCSEVPQDLADLVMTLLEKDPAARPGSARDVAERLAAVDERPRPDLAATAVVAPVSGPFLPKAHLRAGIRRWIVTAIVALVLLAVGALLDRAGQTFLAAPGEKGVAERVHDSRPGKPLAQAITPANAARVELLTELPRDIRDIAWGPAPGEVALLAGDSCVQVLNSESFVPLRTIGAGQRLTHFALRPDGAAVAWSTQQSRVEIHSFEAKRALILDAGAGDPAVAFSPDGRLLATGGYGARASLWDSSTGQLVRPCEAPPTEVGGLTLAFSPDGELLAVANVNGLTHVNEVATGRLLHVLPRKHPQGLKFSPDSKLLAVAYNDGTIALWDAADGNLVVSRETGAQRLFTLDWTPAGDLLATGGQKSTITLWNSRDLSVLRALPALESVLRVSFSPDGSRLLAAGGSIAFGLDRKVLVWGLPPGRD
jgi:hypothetical protein